VWRHECSPQRDRPEEPEDQPQQRWLHRPGARQVLNAAPEWLHRHFPNAPS